jgi:hypothetical protein
MTDPSKQLAGASGVKPVPNTAVGDSMGDGAAGGAPFLQAKVANDVLKT